MTQRFIDLRNEKKTNYNTNKKSTDTLKFQ